MFFFPIRVANFDHLFWWEAHKDCGFPNRVNHASATYATPTGSHGVISVGGYHAEVKKRLEWRLSYEREFHSVPIDVFKLNHGWYAVLGIAVSIQLSMYFLLQYNLLSMCLV